MEMTYCNFFEKFDEEFDLTGLKEDLNQVGTEEGFREVPPGLYEVKIEKLELVASKTGKPMLTCWMKITYGEYQDSLLFLNQVIHTGYGLHHANEFLRSLDSGIDVKFESFTQYSELIFQIYEAVFGNCEYGLVYGETNKGFKTFNIYQKFGVR